jgi:hypothetical protein
MRVLLLILFFPLLGVQNLDAPKNNASFGVRISIGANSEVYNLVGIRYNLDGSIRERRFLSKDDFIRYASGFWPSLYNNAKVDLFEKNGVEGGMIFIDSLNKKIPYCPVLDSLWKIRFDRNPFGRTYEDGWSQGKFKPSLKQELFLLKNYGVKYLDTEYIVDTSFWKLLKDMQSPDWVLEYKNVN